MDFFANLKILYFVLSPLAKAVLSLEACFTTLEDCYLGLAKIGAAIKKLPLQQYLSFKQDFFDIINSHLEEYDNDLYILSYFLLSQFRGII